MPRSEYANNNEQRTPCIIIADTSRSMHGEPIDALNDGLQTFAAELSKHEVASTRIETGLITLNNGQPMLVSDFTTADRLTMPRLTAEGDTPLGAAIILALDTIAARRQFYQHEGIPYTRPIV